MNSLNEKEHLACRRQKAYGASYRIAKYGVLNPLMSAELKSFMINVYCRSQLRYGIENCRLNKKDYISLQTVEARILKSSLRLSKFSATRILLNALKVEPIEWTIKKRKLNFFTELANNSLTRRILEHQLRNHKNLTAKNFIMELIDITRYYRSLDDINNMISKANMQIASINNEIKRSQRDITSLAVRNLLRRNNERNRELLRSILSYKIEKGKGKGRKD